MTEEDKEVGDLLEQLLRKVVVDALKSTVDLETRVEVLKHGGAFWIQKQKAKAKEIEDEKDHPTFAKFKKAIANLGDQNG